MRYGATRGTSLGDAVSSSTASLVIWCRAGRLPATLYVSLSGLAHRWFISILQHISTSHSHPQRVSVWRAGTRQSASSSPMDHVSHPYSPLLVTCAVYRRWTSSSMEPHPPALNLILWTSVIASDLILETWNLHTEPYTALQHSYCTLHRIQHLHYTIRFI